MKIGLLAIGDELLSGSILDTNSQKIAKKLFENGLLLNAKVTVGDADIVEALKEMEGEFDLIITTGGLGPTGDDKTRSALAEVFAVSMVYSLEVESDLQKRYGKDFSQVKGQGEIPFGAKPLLNPIGSAPGLVMERGEKIIISLPGVPQEMTALFERFVLPLLKARRKNADWFSETLHFCQIKEQDLAPLVDELHKEFPDLQFGSYPCYGSCSITIKGKAENRKHFDDGIAPVVKRLAAAHPTLLFSSKFGLIEHALHEKLFEKKEMIAFAESCTGGNLTAKLTKFAGASNYLLGGFTLYSNEMKERILGISEKTLAKYGAVSKQVAIEMVEGVFANTNATWAVSVSGIAGPDGGTEEKPVGTIYAAIGKRGEGIDAGLIPLRLGREREVNIEMATAYIFSALYRKIAYGITPFSNL